MKRFAITLLLTCVLTTSALAGDVPTAGAPQPASSTQTGDVPTAGATQSEGSTETSSIAATVILAIISLIGR